MAGPCSFVGKTWKVLDNTMCGTCMNIWGATFSVGDIVRAVAEEETGLFFKCSNAVGNSSNTEPDWPKEIGNTVVDGGVTWIAISSVYKDVASLTPNAIIELFEFIS